jgi:hypothetical protein
MVRDENRVNQLFINEGNDEKGIPHFSEKAGEYGLASAAYSNQAYFFDCDRDGDLDALLLNHNPKALPILNEVSTAEMFKKDDPLIGVRLYKQNKGHFEDKTVAAGINGSALTYGLGIGIGDFNNDNWPDFYISNDYNVPDYLYMNNHNGTFTNKLEQSIGHTSQFSMGNDVGDINNDGWQDIITLDMLPEDNHRQKLLLAPDNYGKFDLNVRSGFYYQYMRNMLQLNNGNGTFSEIGQLAGISNTDWSWSALLADFDNDGWKDLMVTNGYYRDYTNLDFIKYMDDFVKSKGRLLRENVLEIIQHMPASNVVNYAFSNNKGMSFTNQTKDWGMNRPSNSTGAAYADLDNDGDLDLIVNNVNQPAFIYQNESNKKPDNHYLNIKLNGEGLNSQGIGTKVMVSAKGKRQYFLQMSAHGYLSAVSPVMHIGLGNENELDTVQVTWPTGKQQILTKVKSNQLLTLAEKEGRTTSEKKTTRTTIFEEIKSPISYQPPTTKVNDFKRQPLLTSQPSYNNFCMTKGDVNSDGLDDIYLGGGQGVAACLYIQQKNHQFVRKLISAFETDKNYQDADAVFVDVNNDGLKDLYVVSGGYHNLMPDDALLQDRLYINNGKGDFVRDNKALPPMLVSKSCVRVNDVNGDDFADLFIGGRVIPGRYPETPMSYLLVNDGHGNFTNQIETFAPQLQKIGMITDAQWVDVNQDKKNDLVVVGEWLPVSVFINENGTLQNKTKTYFDKEYSGWWNTIAFADLNHDNQLDLIVGNLGTNTQLKASDQQPLELYYSDFDNNGSVDPFLCSYIQGKSYPYVTRDESLEQIASLRKRFTTFESYADVTLTDIFKQEELSKAGHLTATTMQTMCFVSKDQKFTPVVLPEQAQYSSIYAITTLDYNKDGNEDILLCGNNDHLKLRLGKSDANYGALLRGNGTGSFQYVEQSVSGLNLKGDVRQVIDINNVLFFGRSQQALISYKIKK